MGVGDHLGHRAEADRVVTHLFDCPHPGYRGWQWSVTLVRAARAKAPTVNEVVLLPGDESLVAPAWLPWAERIQPKDVGPGVVFPTPDDDPRLVPGYTDTDQPADADPAEMSQVRSVVTELGLGRERVLSPEGRDLAAERWLNSDGGADNPMTRQAAGACVDCGYFIRLSGHLGTHFGVCANAYSASDGEVVTVDHGCGAHSDLVAEQQAKELPRPVWDTISWEESDSLFD